MPESVERFFSIRNWDKFQHYKHRNPPWIRLYQTLLRERDYQRLTDVQRSHLIGLFLLAAQHDNKIPDDQEWLKHELCTKAAIDLKTLTASGWLEYGQHDASTMLAMCTQVAPNSCSETDSTDNTEKRQRQIIQTAVADPVLMLGEFQMARMTSAEYATLKTELNGHTDDYIKRFDWWVHEAPQAKANGVMRKDRHAYESCRSWYAKDLKEGKVSIKRPNGVRL